MGRGACQFGDQLDLTLSSHGEKKPQRTKLISEIWTVDKTQAHMRRAMKSVVPFAASGAERTCHPSELSLSPVVLSSSRPPPPCEGSATSTLSHHGSRRKRPQRRQPVSFSSVPPYRPVILTPTGLFLQRRPRRVQMVRCQRFQPPRKLSRSLCHGASWSLAKWSRFTLVCSRGRQRRSSHKGARGEATGQGSRGGGDGARFGSAIAPKSRCCYERQFDSVGSERRAECTSGDGSR